jgi:hypothetical protein
MTREKNNHDCFSCACVYVCICVLRELGQGGTEGPRDLTNQRKARF